MSVDVMMLLLSSRDCVVLINYADAIDVAVDSISHGAFADSMYLYKVLTY